MNVMEPGAIPIHLTAVPELVMIVMVLVKLILIPTNSKEFGIIKPSNIFCFRKRIDKMSDLNIEQWIDMDGPDFKRVGSSTMVRKVIAIGLQAGIITLDKAGYMWQGTVPVYAELDGKLVGLRFSAKAVN